MAGIDAFLDAYGLAAIFLLMLVKAAGVPIPIPGDVIMLATAARAAEGRFLLWQAFLAILVALVLGGIVQFGLARGPARGAVYRFGRYLGLTPARLDAAARRIERGGTLTIGLAILTPGVRTATIPACGLAGLPLRTFVPGLVLGNSLFLSLHFFLGFIGGALLASLPPGLIGPWSVAGAGALLVVGLAVWLFIRRRQRPAASRGDLAAEAFAAWHDATCPACLVLGAASESVKD